MMKIECWNLSQRIDKIAKVIKNADTNNNHEIVQGEVKLTPIQKWFFEQHFSEQNHFNQAVLLENQSEWNRDYVQKVLNQLIEQHDALRMKYLIHDNVIEQYNCSVPEKCKQVEYREIEQAQNADEVMLQDANELHKKFDLERGELLEAKTYHTVRND